MYLDRLTCTGFRCLQKIDFEPGPRINLVHGGNAQGKTSLLEAIFFAATSKSHRTNVEGELAAHGESGFSIKMNVRRRDRKVILEANWHEGTKRFRINGVRQPRVSDILGTVSVVFFSPEDIALVKGSAAVRRKFLDMELSQINPLYLAALQRYRQALRQRNELLRARKVDLDQLKAWDQQLAEHGEILRRERSGFIAELAELAREAYARISGGEILSLEYRSDVPSEEALVDVLERNRSSDVKRRMTGRGPHRDDLDIQVDGHPARSHASQGQQKTAALALKLAELELVKRRVGEYPILMLDEVLAELDAQRARHLFDAIDSEVQCIVTTTELETRPDLFGESCTNFNIEAGRLTPHADIS